MFKVGDKVLFSLAGDNQKVLKSCIGIILDKKDDSYTILRLNKWKTMAIYYEVAAHKIESLGNVAIVREDIVNYYNEEIERLKGELQVVTEDIKNREQVEKYTKLKQQIKATAKNLYETQDDLDFENKLKAICRLKNQIFSIELDCISTIRKHNGHVWYNIRETARIRDDRLKNISDEMIKEVFDGFAQ